MADQQGDAQDRQHRTDADQRRQHGRHQKATGDAGCTVNGRCDQTGYQDDEDRPDADIVEKLDGAVDDQGVITRIGSPALKAAIASTVWV